MSQFKDYLFEVMSRKRYSDAELYQKGINDAIYAHCYTMRMYFDDTNELTDDLIEKMPAPVFAELKFYYDHVAHQVKDGHKDMVSCLHDAILDYHRGADAVRGFVI